MCLSNSSINAPFTSTYDNFWSAIKCTVSFFLPLPAFWTYWMFPTPRIFCQSQLILGFNSPDTSNMVQAPSSILLLWLSHLCICYVHFVFWFSLNTLCTFANFFCCSQFFFLFGIVLQVLWTSFYRTFLEESFAISTFLKLTFALNLLKLLFWSSRLFFDYLQL